MKSVQASVTPGTFVRRLRLYSLVSVPRNISQLYFSVPRNIPYFSIVIGNTLSAVVHSEPLLEYL
jgi:hypothetical protein